MQPASYSSHRSGIGPLGPIELLIIGPRTTEWVRPRVHTRFPATRDGKNVLIQQMVVVRASETCFADFRWRIQQTNSSQQSIANQSLPTPNRRHSARYPPISSRHVASFSPQSSGSHHQSGTHRQIGDTPPNRGHTTNRGHTAKPSSTGHLQRS